MKNLKTPLGIIGLLYLIFGLVMNVWMFASAWWPTYLYFIAMGIGIFFVLISGLTKRLPKYKIWQIIIGTSPIIAFYIFIQVNKASEDIFILPENFKGIITVIYGQKTGTEKEFENGKRVYRIPNNGVLKTQFDLKGETVSFGEYYYETDEKERIRIESFPYHEPFPDSTKIYVHTWKLLGATDHNGNEITYQQVTIGTKTDSFETDKIKIIEQ